MLRHGESHRDDSRPTPEYTAWGRMKERCYNPGNHHFRHYGGRGIAVCDKWRASFEAFLADMGRRPSASHSLDRIDNDGDYGPGNCRWATREQQARNQRRTVRVVLGGSAVSLSEACERHGIDRRTVKSRARRGEGLVSAISRPVRGIICKAGHPLDNANTRIRKNGSRVCRICSQAAVMRYRHRKKTTP